MAQQRTNLLENYSKYHYSLLTTKFFVQYYKKVLQIANGFQFPRIVNFFNYLFLETLLNTFIENVGI